MSAVTDEPIPGLPRCRERGRDIQDPTQRAADAPDRGQVCIVGRNPKALWFYDDEDRVLFDEAGLFDYKRVKPVVVSGSGRRSRLTDRTGVIDKRGRRPALGPSPASPTDRWS